MSVIKNINCIYSDNGIYCKNNKIKRSLFGFGARVCKNVDSFWDDKCDLIEKYPEPKCIRKGKLKMNIKVDEMTEEQAKNILKDLISKLNELDSEDYFGTEGWKHFLGFEE